MNMVHDMWMISVRQQLASFIYKMHWKSSKLSYSAQHQQIRFVLLMKIDSAYALRSVISLHWKPRSSFNWGAKPALSVIDKMYDHSLGCLRIWKSMYAHKISSHCIFGVESSRVATYICFLPIRNTSKQCQPCTHRSVWLAHYFHYRSDKHRERTLR